jgi:acyl-coenzyme A thioesterase PaaI-like protein
MEPRTHPSIDRRLCGEPLELGPGTARVAFTGLPEMAADDRGLIHGGFVFGLADYAAMLAVNEPHVVLAGAEVRFLKPVAVGERLVAEARVDPPEGTPPEGTNTRKSRVRVEVLRDGEAVMTGDFRCVTLDRHVFEASAPRTERS